MSQKIRIKLKSYDHNLVDKSAEKIVKTVKTTHAQTGFVLTGKFPSNLLAHIWILSKTRGISQLLVPIRRHKALMRG